MDPELQQKIDEARENGYSEQEIQTYLQSLNTPTPAEQAAATGASVSTVENIDRSAEYTGLTQGAIIPPVVSGIGTGLVAYGTYQGAKYLAPKIIDAVKKYRGVSSIPPNSMVGPMQNSNTPISSAAQRVPITTGPVAPPGMSAPAPAPAAPAPQISNAKNIVQKLALDKILPAMGNMASKALPAAQVAAGLFYTSPEEIAILKAAEEKKKQAQGIKR
jgi:hypothetical protein